MAGDKLRDTLSGQASILNELVAQVIEPQLNQCGITFSSFQLLSCVKSAASGTPQAEIARRLGITPPSLTEAVRAAVRQGLLEQHGSERDRRTKTLSLTPLAAKKIGEILRAVNKAEETMVQDISQEDLRLALEVLRAANRNLAVYLENSETG